MTPSLSQVLTQGGAAAHQPVNPLFLLAGLTVFFLAAFSAVKGVELFRRRRLLPPVLEEAAPLARLRDDEEREKLSFLVDEIKCEKTKLAVENTELQGKIQELNDALSNVKQTRDAMEKSNLVLLKESARLKSEKEDLVLQAATPLIAVSRPAPAKKAAPVPPAVKARKTAKSIKSVKPVKAVKNKKGDSGKPARVKKKHK